MGKAFGKIIDSVITGIKISLQRRLIQRFHSSLKHNDTGYYFYYEPQQITVLDYDFLAAVTEKAGGTVIYADRCSIDDSKLSQMGIVFKKIPRDISRL